MTAARCIPNNSFSLRNRQDFEWRVSTLAGAKPTIIQKLETEHQVEEKYKTKWERSKHIAKFMTSLSYFDNIRFNQLKKKLDKFPAPVFILGHWRSGTTLLHNMLCDITDAAYCTTYQNLFPNNLFAFYNIIQPAVQLFMPSKRPADNVKMHTLYPQEEEFALGNEVDYCFYYWMFFPKDTYWFSDHYLTGKSARPKSIEAWKRNYLRFVKRCILLTGGKQFISKNPPNTARIPLLLDIFPNAKFIFLHRNPYEVVSSTIRFYKGVLPAQQHQSITDEALEAQVLKIYEELHNKYLKDKTLIPNGNLVELPFEQFIQAPLKRSKQLMADFQVPTNITQKIKRKYRHDGHKARQYHFPKEWSNKVNRELGPFFETFQYAKI